MGVNGATRRRAARRRAAAAGGAILALLGAGARPAEAAAADCAATADLAWPVPDWPEAAPEGPAEAVAALAAYAFPEGGDEVAREGIRTNALLIAKDGRLVFERYARGFGPDKPHIEWSVSKSVVSALVGRAVAEGLVPGVDAPASAYVPALRDGAKAGITLGQLLGMTSGLDYEEAYEFAPLWSDVVAMLYTRGRADMAAYAAARPLAAAPGEAWSYGSGDSVLLAAALRGIVGEARYPDWPWAALFDPLGMEGAAFERDAAGTFIGSSNLYLRPRDLLRFGLLYARDGCWAGGRRLLPEGWVAYTGEVVPAQLEGPAGLGWRRAYGAHWWLNRPLPDGAPAMLAGAPEDALVASGHWGQFAVALPSLDLVIARNGDDRDGSFSLGRLTRLALAAFAPAGAPR